MMVNQMEKAYSLMKWLRMPRVLEAGDFAPTMDLLAIKSLAEANNKKVRERQ